MIVSHSFISSNFKLHCASITHPLTFQRVAFSLKGLQNNLKKQKRIHCFPFKAAIDFYLDACSCLSFSTTVSSFHGEDKVFQWQLLCLSLSVILEYNHCLYFRSRLEAMALNGKKWIVLVGLEIFQRAHRACLQVWMYKTFLEIFLSDSLCYWDRIHILSLFSSFLILVFLQKSGFGLFKAIGMLFTALSSIG